MNLKPILELEPCEDGLEWLKAQPSMSAAWKNCERGDWMLWLLGKLAGPPESASRKKLVLAACACARLSLKYVAEGEESPRLAIETAENWARGEGATLEGVLAAAAAAYTAAASAAAAAAYNAAAAAYNAAVYASSAYASSAARKKTLLRCADIVRGMYPGAPRIGGKK
jgi:hypothetical protein